MERGASSFPKSMRILVSEERKCEVGLQVIQRDLLEGLMTILRAWLFCVQDFPARGVFDVTFMEQDQVTTMTERKLQRYCSVVAKPIKLVNMFGVYNDKRKVFVTLQPDPSERVYAESLRTSRVAFSDHVVLKCKRDFLFVALMDLVERKVCSIQTEYTLDRKRRALLLEWNAWSVPFASNIHVTGSRK
ncbi:Hypothetical predicted protein [Pelobates cultripes]|uniref:Zinc finger CCHC domain-containing protein n=1 Tax=Pelobates cultripes TaxID=61616 RepID=A0AAD1TLZ9_PELCU|nr:Hypothetical predicted protein [Pelobates cultripes]